MSALRISRAVAIHEAAHAVARLHVGAPATPVEVRPNGAGLTDGTLERWVCRSTGQYAAWDKLTVTLAGGCAEARASKRSPLMVFLSGGASDDYANAQPVIGWLVEQGYAQDEHQAWSRAEAETKAFVREQWASIERVADMLQRHGRLEGHEVVAAVTV